MIEYLVNLDNYIPNYCIKSVFDINYTKLYEEGKRIILFDIDNTLVSYDMDYASNDIKELIENLKIIGFKMMLVSNNNKKRVKLFAESINLPFIYNAFKPFSYSYRKALRLMHGKNSEAFTVGDQMMTDIRASKKAKIDAIMVKCLKRSSEKWYTKINRIMEKRIMKRIKKERPLAYQELLKVKGVENEK